LDFHNLTAKPRTTKGNSPARVLRRDGAIPAVLYGPGKASTSLRVSVYDLEQVLKAAKGSQVFVNLEIEGAATYKAMLKELQRHPVKVMVPVTTVGQCQGVEMGGMLQIIRRELEALCKLSDIPDKIEIDITDLGMGESVHVEDVQVEGDVELVHDVNFTILTVLSGRKATEEEEAEEGEAEAAGEEEGAEASAAE
jgi:large subunit ribosomal protein L25